MENILCSVEYYAFYLFAVTHYTEWMTCLTKIFTEVEDKASLIPEVDSLRELCGLM